MDQHVRDLLLTNLEVRDSYVLSQILDSCKEAKALTDEGDFSNKLCKAINWMLSSALTRGKGFELMNFYLSQTKAQQVVSQAGPWMNHCVRELEKENSSEEVVSALVSLLVKSKIIPELRREALNYIIPRLMVVLVEKKDKLLNPSVLNIVDTLLTEYGKSCGSYKSSLEMLLLRTIDCPSMLSEGRKCFTKLCLVGPPNRDGENYTEAWSSYQAQLIATIHLVIDQLFENVTEVQGYNKISTDDLSLPIIKEKDHLRRAIKLSDRFVALNQFLVSLLLEKLDLKKNVLINSIPSVCCRVLSVHCKTLSSTPTSKNVALMTQIPKLHIASLELLDAFAQCCRTNLIFQAPILCKLPLQALTWTQDTSYSYGEEKSYIGIRVAAYQVLDRWMTVSLNASQIEDYADDLLPLLVSDFSYSKPHVKMSCKKVKSKQVKEALRPTETGERNPLANKEVCVAALRCTQRILVAAVSKIKPKMYFTLQENIVKLLMQIQGNSSKAWPIPYVDVECRRELYATFLALVINYHSKFPPPVHFSTSIFQKGLTDGASEIVEFCSSAVRTIGIILGPFISTLKFPSTIDDGLLGPILRSGEAMEESLGKTTNGDMEETQINEVDENAMEEVNDNVENGLRDEKDELMDENKQSQNGVANPASPTPVVEMFNEDVTSEPEEKAKSDLKISRRESPVVDMKDDYIEIIEEIPIEVQSQEVTQINFKTSESDNGSSTPSHSLHSTSDTHNHNLGDSGQSSKLVNTTSCDEVEMLESFVDLVSDDEN